MSKISHQAKVYNMLKDANGPVTVDQLLSIEGLLPYKLSAYVLYAKIDFGAVIVPVRDGRKVTAYQMVDPGTGIPAPQPRGRKPGTTVAKAQKPTKAVTAKAPKAKKTVTVPEVVDADPIVMKSSKVVDVLDEMDTDVASFEDRQFAEDFVRSL